MGVVSGIAFVPDILHIYSRKNNLASVHFFSVWSTDFSEFIMEIAFRCVKGLFS